MTSTQPAGRFAGQGVVVTGAAGGIGAALARRVVAEGGQVVVNDLDVDAIGALATEIDAIAIPGDCASVDGARALVAMAGGELGQIDAFFANAGVDIGRGIDTDEEVWERSFEVNVMSHVRTARALIPTWLEDGVRGRFVVTASAAGLLTMIEAAPYSVTKHGAVAFAEWLQIKYAHHGIQVHAICPQGVRTRMYDEAGPLKSILGRDAVLEPDDIADSLCHAIDEDRFLVLPHPEVADYYTARATKTDRWLHGMNKVQQQIEPHLEQP